MQGQSVPYPSQSEGGLQLSHGGVGYESKFHTIDIKIVSIIIDVMPFPFKRYNSLPYTERPL